MAEDIKYIDPVVPTKGTENKDYIVTAIGRGRGAKTKYRLVYPVPQTDEEAQERYGVDLFAIRLAGVKAFTTGPDYSKHELAGKSVWQEDGTLVPGGHEELQKLADGYKPGQRTAGEGAKAKAAKFDELSQAATLEDGTKLSNEDMRAIIEQHVANLAKAAKSKK